MEETFGQRLRRERERRKIALESIAANTKISRSLLAALERDDTSRWPSGVFRRAFIRSYAEAIGLNPDYIAREFLERFPDPLDTPQPSVPATRRKASAAPRPAALRLTMEDTRSWFSGGEFLAGRRRRWAAVGCDVGTVALMTVLMCLVLGAFWMPLALSALSYYAVSIVVLGNTPGVCLFAPGREDLASRT